ncbi:DUF397 domain-containing protein [Actinokineospora sp. 24-640]
MTQESRGFTNYGAIGHLNWFKSSASGGNGGNCIEVAWNRDEILVRDSLDHQGGRLHIPTSSWNTFTRKFRPS